MEIFYNYWYGVASMPDERCTKIKQAGFNNIALYYADDFVSANGKVKDIIKTMQNKNLNFDALHFSFVNAGDIWEKGLTGYKRYKSYKNLIINAKSLHITNFVMHLNDERDINATNTGLKRIQKLLKLCKKFNINIAFENLTKVDSHIETIKPLLDKFSNAKICYDVGHSNITSFDAEKYIDKISVFHLHDNYGIKDEHNMPFDGNVNWDNVFNLIKMCNNPLIVLELHRPGISAEQEQEYLKQCYKVSLKVLQNLEQVVLLKR